MLDSSSTKSVIELYPLTSIVAVAAFLLVWMKFSTKQRLPDLPTLKVSDKPGRLGAAEDIKMYMEDHPRMCQIGYERYSVHGQNYIVNMPKGMFGGKLVVCAPKFLEEIRRAPESHVNNQLANMELMQFDWTLSPEVAANQYHMDVPVRKSLTQNLGPSLPSIVEEGKLCLEKRIPSAKDWTAYNAHDFSAYTITRTANRVLFGKEMARNDEFTDLCIKHTATIFLGANYIRNYPSWMKSFLLWKDTALVREQAVASRLLGPILKKRIEDMERLERSSEEDLGQEKANDVMQWILDVTPLELRQVPRLVLRMLNISAAAIHTTSSTFLDIFNLLALTPDIHDDLREEIIRIFRKEGAWTKQALTYLVKMDSLMTESTRVTSGASAIRLIRRAIKDWKLSDGSVLPKGTTFCIPVREHFRHDSTIFEDPTKFDPYRMYRKRQKDGELAKHQFVMSSEHNLFFGHGVHACPGRFFSSNEIKTLLTTMIMKYDIRGSCPGGIEAAMVGKWYGMDRVPQDVKVEFRSREHLIPEDLRTCF